MFSFTLFFDLFLFLFLQYSKKTPNTFLSWSSNTCCTLFSCGSLRLSNDNSKSESCKWKRGKNETNFIKQLILTNSKRALWRKKSQLTKRALRRKKNYNWQKKEKKISTTWQQLCYFVTVSSNQIIWEQHAQCQEPRSYFLLKLVKCIKCFHGCVAQCCQQVVTLPYSVKIFAKFRCFI